jgi:hypothetical protein
MHSKHKKREDYRNNLPKQTNILEDEWLYINMQKKEGIE